jgi:hypothetical protein
MKQFILFILLLSAISCKTQSSINKVYNPIRESITVLSDSTLEIIDSFEDYYPNKISINIVNDELTLDVLNSYGDAETSYISFFISAEANDNAEIYIFQNEYSTIKMIYNKSRNRIVNVSIRDVRYLTIQTFIL